MTQALLIVDMQNAYFANAKLREQKDRLVAHCNQLIDAASAADVPIIMLRTLHERDKSTWTLNMLQDKKGYLFAGDMGSQYVDGLKTAGAIEIVKTRDSGFWQTDLLSTLRDRGVEAVVIAGVSTHSCIMATAMDAYNANLLVAIACDAVGSHDPRYHDVVLNMLRQEYRIETSSASQLSW